MGLLGALRGVLGGTPDAETSAESDSDGDEQNALRYDGPSEDARRLSPEVLAEKADAATRTWESYDLDYTLDSLARLDDVAQRHGERVDAAGAVEESGGVAANTRTGPTLEAGSYFGEVLVRQLDGEWTWEDRWTVTVFGDSVSGSVPVFDVAARSFVGNPTFHETATELADGIVKLDDRDDVTAAAEAGVEMAAKAADFASKWESYDLDFSPASLARLDELVETEFPDRQFKDVPLYDGDNADSMVLTIRSLEAGGYLAEVFRRTVGGKWRDDEGFYFLVEGPHDAVDVQPVRAAAECYRGIGSFRRLYDIVTKSVSTSGAEHDAEDWEWEGPWQRADDGVTDDAATDSTSDDDPDRVRLSE